MSLSWQAFLTICISLAILLLVTYLKEKLNPLSLIFLLIFNMLGWLAYFSIALKIFYIVTKEIIKCLGYFFVISNGFTMFFQYNRFLMKGFLWKQRKYFLYLTYTFWESLLYIIYAIVQVFKSVCDSKNTFKTSVRCYDYSSLIYTYSFIWN